MQIASLPSYCPLMGFQNYEGPKNNEEPALDSRSHFADLTKIRTENSGYQEGLSTARHLGSSVLTCFRFSQAIDTLLEKEYIERVEGTRDTFAYMA